MGKYMGIGKFSFALLAAIGLLGFSAVASAQVLSGGSSGTGAASTQAAFGVLENKVNTANKNINNLVGSQLPALQSQVDQVQTDLTALQSQVNQNTQDIANLKNAVTNINATMNTLNQTISNISFPDCQGPDDILQADGTKLICKKPPPHTTCGAFGWPNRCAGDYNAMKIGSGWSAAKCQAECESRQALCRMQHKAHRNGRLCRFANLNPRG